MNNIHNRLCPGQINSSIQKSALRKLSRLRNPGSCLYHGFQYLPHHKDAAMTVNFHGIFCRIASGRFHDRNHHLIYNSSFFLRDITIMNRMRIIFSQSLFISFISIYSVNNFNRLVTAHSDNTDSGI